MDYTDPDAFDWDDSAGDGLLEAVDAFASYCQSVLGRPDPIAYVRPSLFSEDGPRPIFRVRYHLANEQVHWLADNYGGWQFDYTDARRHHDHPLSHLSRELDELEMVESFRRENYHDLFGNPGRNAKWGRGCATWYTDETAKDYIRYYEKRGALKFDLPRFLEILKRPGSSKNVTLTHALYYVDLQTLARICQTGVMVHALVHRHELSHGFLNNGEQEYWVDMNGDVTQTNIETGEKYCHPSLEPFFHQTSATTDDGGIVWDIRKSGPDSYVIRFVAAPNEKCETFRTLDQLGSSDSSVIVVDDITVHSFFGYKWYTKGEGKQAVQLTDVELLEKARRYIAGRKRTKDQYDNLMNFIRRNCNKNDVISVHGGRCHEIPANQMVDYCNVAFYMDMKKELESAIHFVQEYKPIQDALNEYYESGTLPSYLITPGAAVKIVTKRAVDAVGVARSVLSRFHAETPSSRPRPVDWASNGYKPKMLTQYGAKGIPVRLSPAWEKVWKEAHKV